MNQTVSSMSQTQNVTYIKKKQEISAALNHFYANPVAQVSVELFLTIALVLFLGLFAIKPTIVTMSDLLKEIETKKELETSLTKKVAALQTAQAEYVRVENKLELLEEAIPENPDIIHAAKIIEKVAADNKVIIKNMSIAELPEETKEDISFDQKTKESIKISTNIAGDYISIRGFVEDLKNSRKSFTVESVVFSLEENKGDKKLSANITINSPYFGVNSIKNKTTNK